ncbi:MAG: hypothetical protein JXR83_09970, partial [Deltaproteobacteria bacterium]|nr:hypothetical protein [Deltaproteobacteria bacterium]
ALAAILLGGELQSFCAALAIVGAEIAIRLWRHRRRALGRCLRQALALLAGALAGNGPWLGFLAEERLTQRFGPLDLAQAAHWSFEPALWPALLLPGRLFSVPLPHTSLWLMAQRGPLADTAWNPAPYLGLLLFAALATACWQRGTRLAAVCAGTGLLLALGDTTPLFSSLVALLPPLALFRYPAKYLVVTTLACCVVAMVGLQRLRRRPAAWRRFMIAGLVLLAGGALAALAVTVWRDALDTLTRDLGDHAPAFDWPPLAALLRWSLLRALLPLAAALLLGALWRSGRRWLPWIAVADLMLAGLGAVQLGPPLARLDSPLEALGTGRDRPATVLCVADEPEPDPTAVGATSNWALLALRRQYGSVELQACGGLSNACGYGTLQSSANRLLQAAMMLGHASAARALGCTHVITGGSGDGQGPGHPTVVAVDSPIPTAFVARSPRLVASDEELLWRIYATTSAAQALAVVDDPLRRISRLVDLPPGDSVEIDSADWPTRDRATLRLRGSGGAVVGLRTSFQVGWQAHQAGRALPVIRTSGQHVAAVVDDARAGPIELEYRSPLLAAGCALSPLGALGLAGLALWRPRRGGRA